MSAMWPINTRRRNPFAPPDQSQDQDLPPITGPSPEMPPAPQQQADQSDQAGAMFTPPPTSIYEPPRRDALQQATATLQPGSAQPSVFGPPPADQAAPRKTNIMGDIVEIPPPPVHKPLPQPTVFEPSGAFAARRAAVADENRYNDMIYAQRMRLYENQASARALYGSYGAGRAPQYVRGADGKVHLRSFNTSSGQWETSPEEAVIPQAEAADIRAGAIQPKPPTSLEVWMGQHPGADIKDYFAIQPSVQTQGARPEPTPPNAYSIFTDKEGRSWIFNNRTGKAEPMAAGGPTGELYRPGSPRAPAVDRGDPRREQFIKEYLRQNPGDEEGLTEQLAIYDRGNSPAIRKGRAAANQPAGQPHPPLGAQPGAAAPQRTLTNFHVNPRTGQRIGWDGRQWRDTQTGQPVQ